MTANARPVLIFVSRNDSVKVQPERGVHAASPCERWVMSNTKRKHHSVRMLKRRERRAPPASPDRSVPTPASLTAAFRHREINQRNCYE